MVISVREIFSFHEAGLLPSPGDNVAIAIKTLKAGSQIQTENGLFEIPFSILEGHRFAVETIDAGQNLLSWGLPFGIALGEISPGEYICNEKILKVLRQRNIPFAIPEQPNFKDHRFSFKLELENLQPCEQVPLKSDCIKTFQGFLRGNHRSAGTRNYLVVVGATSKSSGFVRELAARFNGIKNKFPNVDGVVPVAHTECGGTGKPNNFELTLRTLAGFLVNPNVGGFICIDQPGDILTNQHLQGHLKANGYPYEEMIHRFVTQQNSFSSDLESMTALVEELLPLVNESSRSEVPISYLKFGLQCGGSDAFSGVSGNPLVGWLAQKLVEHGGSANLAETDELIGAEPYILAKVKNKEVARQFLKKIERFQEWASWHGHSAEGNPSGGNMWRGLYNIAIKSIGAARKKSPDLRLDYVIDFGQRMEQPGFYFMDSPGNDLESIAGQVAAGCNMILFATGNGSITNFPFVPTIKIMTTTARFNLLHNEMDVNAGKFLDGMPLKQLGTESMQYIIDTASGRLSAGERAGHSQVQLWREWRQKAPESLEEKVFAETVALGTPFALRELTDTEEQFNWELPKPKASWGLILPTSLCSGQISGIIARQLNQSQSGTVCTRFVSLAHTEGCGNSGGIAEQLFMRTMAGYAMHPLIKKVLLLEHGCEKTHNDAMRQQLNDLGSDVNQFGFASIQNDGGIDAVVKKVSRWFSDNLGQVQNQSLPFILGISNKIELNPDILPIISRLIRVIVRKGGSVVIPANCSLAIAPDLWKSLTNSPVIATLGYGQVIKIPGLHLMKMPTDHWVETLTGLAASGASAIAVFTNDPIQKHPFVPVLEISTEVISKENSMGALATKISRSLEDSEKDAFPMDTDFQVTRGLTGVSL